MTKGRFDTEWVADELGTEYPAQVTADDVTWGPSADEGSDVEVAYLYGQDMGAYRLSDDGQFEIRLGEFGLREGIQDLDHRFVADTHVESCQAAQDEVLRNTNIWLWHLQPHRFAKRIQPHKREVHVDFTGNGRLTRNREFINTAQVAEIVVEELRWLASREVVDADELRTRADEIAEQSGMNRQPPDGLEP